VNGSNFAAGLAVSLKRPDGSILAIGSDAVSQVTPASFHVSLVLNVAGTYAVRVTNPSGKASDWKWITVKSPEITGPPTVTSITPTTPVVSAEAKPFYVFGTNLAPGLTVSLVAPGGQLTTIGGSSITVGGSTVFSMKVTFAAAGSYTLKVVNPNGDVSNVFAFSVSAAQ
jgi:hypothetical protein